MATQTRRRIPAILFVIALALPALPALGTPPDHAPAHGLNKPGGTQASPTEQNQGGGNPEHCDGEFTKIDSASGSADLDGATLEWGGSTLLFTVQAGYTLSICLKSALVTDSFFDLTGDGTVATMSGKDISHIGYRLTVAPVGQDDAPVIDEGTSEETQEDSRVEDGAAEEEEDSQGEDEDSQGEDENSQGNPAEGTEDAGTKADTEGEDDTTSENDGAGQTVLPPDTKVTEDPVVTTPTQDTQAAPETEVAAAVVSAPPAAVPNSVTAAPVSPPAVVTASPADATVAAVFVAPDTLPFTGAESTTHMAYGASILLAGAAFVLAGRERKIGRHEAR